MENNNKYEAYLPYCKTEKQKEVLRHLSEGNSFRETANILNFSSNGTVSGVYKTVKNYAESQGFYWNSGSTYNINDNQYVKGLSTLYDENGNKKLEWIKTSKTYSDEVDKIHSVIEGMKTDELIREKTPLPEKAIHNDPDLLNTYILSDYHLGMMAWGEETGDQDWDLKIAKEKLIKWFKYAISLSPSSQNCVFAQLGDFLHWDGLNAVTPAHGNILDADTRYQKIVRTSIELISEIIQMLLEKYTHVHVLMAEGNHDEASSAWLRELFKFYYSKEPRITVDNSPQCYYGIEHGDVSLFFHHGHKKNINGVAEMFASKFRSLLGRTKYSYAHIGHEHNWEVKETSLMPIERHRTLIPKDSYSGPRYASERSSSTITYHKDFGEVARQVISIDMIS